MKGIFIILIGVSCIFPTCLSAQKLASEARGASTSQIVMLSVNNRGCAAGIVVGYDDKTIYIATADHVTSSTPSSEGQSIKVKFYGVVNARVGKIFGKHEVRSAGDLAVVLVDRDDEMSKFVDTLNFAMLPEADSLAQNAPVTSIGCYGGTFWALGSKETLLATDRDHLQVQSDVGEGQSGGGLFNEAWELIGMPLDVGVNQISVRPIAAAIHDLRAWNVPVLLAPRPFKDRVVGAEELARENARLAQRTMRRSLAQTLATQSEELHVESPVRSLLLSTEAVQATSEDGITIAPAREALVQSLLDMSGAGLSGHTEEVFRASFNADDTLLATASRDGVIRVWSLADPTAPSCIKVFHEPVQGNYVINESLVFDNESKSLISLALGKDAHLTSPRIWQLNTPELNGNAQWLIPGHVSATALAASPDHKLIAVADMINRLLVYTSGKITDKPARVLAIPLGYKVSHIFFSRDNTVVAAGTSDAQVLIWNLSGTGAAPTAVFDTGHREHGPMEGGERPDLDLLDISDDHSLLVTGSSHWSLEGSFADPTLRIWPLKDLRPTSAPWVIDQSGADASKVVIDAFFEETTHSLVGVTWSGNVNSWDLSKAHFDGKIDQSSPSSRFKVSGYAQSDARSSKRGLLALTQSKGVVLRRTTDLADEKSPDIRNLSGFDGAVEFAEFSGSGRFLVAGGLGGTARLWDLDRIDPLAPESTFAPNPYSGVKAIELSSSGYLAITLRGSSLEFWDISHPKEPELRFATDIDLKQFGDCIACHIVIAPNDRWIAVQSGEEDRSQIVEIGANKSVRRTFPVAARTWRNTSEIIFSPDSRFLLVEEKGEIRVQYNLTDNSPERTIFSSSGSYFDPTFSPDAKWVCFRAIGLEYKGPPGRDHAAGFLAPADALSDLTKRVQLTGFKTGIGSVNFSPDGHWLALSGESNFEARDQDDRDVELLHLDGGVWVKQADFTPIEYAATGLRFSPDGHWLFTGSGDITLGDRNVSARVWPLNEPITPNSGQRLSNVIWNLKLVEFSPDSKWLVTVSGAESYARLWSVKDGKLHHVSVLIGPQPKLNNHWSAAFSPDSQSVVLWTIDDATPFFWNLKEDTVSPRGIPLPNGDREIKDVKFSPSSRALTILNSGGTTTGTSGSEGSHFVFIDVTTFPSEDSYAVIPASAGAYAHVYREDLGLLLSAGETLTVASTDLTSQLRRAQFLAGRNFTWEEWMKSPLRGQYRPTFPSNPVGADVIEGQLPGFADLVTEHPDPDAERIKKDLIQWTLQLDDAETCNDLAWEFAKIRDAKQSLELSSCALSLSPSDPSYHDTRGVGLALLGRREEAIQDFEFFLKNVQGIERFARDVPVRQRWIELLRSGNDPFTDGIE